MLIYCCIFVAENLTITKMNTSQNFFLATAANFKSCKTPTTPPDFVSESGSEYWYTQDGVYRQSNHWGGKIATCSWFIDGESSHSIITGFCAWDAFRSELGLQFATTWLEYLSAWISENDRIMSASAKNARQGSGQVYNQIKVKNLTKSVTSGFGFKKCKKNYKRAV